MWAEGAPGHGATFYFSLNAKDTPMNDTPIPLAEDNPEPGTARPAPLTGGTTAR